MRSAFHPPTGTVTELTTRTRTPPATVAATTPAIRTRSRGSAAESAGRGIDAVACLFGWLTATGTAAAQLVLLGAVGTAVGLSRDVDWSGTAGVVAGLLALIALLSAYFCGGYVAGRMARGDGAAQGVGTWLWGVIVASALTGVITLLIFAADSRETVFTRIGAVLPRPTVNDQQAGSCLTLLVVAVATLSLIGAVLGGRAGHRTSSLRDRSRSEAER